MRTLPMAHGTIRTCSATVISPLAIALQEKADGIDRQARVFPIKKTVDLARQRRYHDCRAGPKEVTKSRGRAIPKDSVQILLVNHALIYLVSLTPISLVIVVWRHGREFSCAYFFYCRMIKHHIEVHALLLVIMVLPLGSQKYLRTLLIRIT